MGTGLVEHDGGHRPRHGITLVELLVVIAVIGVLIGLLFPAIEGVRETGRRTTCVSNLRQCGVAMTLYLDRKSRGTFPDAAQLPSFEILQRWPADPIRPSIAAILGPFIGESRNVFRCPSDFYYFERTGGQAEIIKERWNSIPVDQRPKEYLDIPYEGTSYEYPALRLAKKNLEQVEWRRTAKVPKKLIWVLYEFEAFHASGVAAARQLEEVEANRTDEANWTPPDGTRNFVFLDEHVDAL